MAEDSSVQEQFLTAREVAARMRVSVATVAAMRRAGMRAVITGVRKYLYKESDVVAFIAKQNGKKS